MVTGLSPDPAQPGASGVGLRLVSRAFWALGRASSRHCRTDAVLTPDATAGSFCDDGAERKAGNIKKRACGHGRCVLAHLKPLQHVGKPAEELEERLNELPASRGVTISRRPWYELEEQEVRQRGLRLAHLFRRTPSPMDTIDLIPSMTSVASVMGPIIFPGLAAQASSCCCSYIASLGGNTRLISVARSSAPRASRSSCVSRCLQRAGARWVATRRGSDQPRKKSSKALPSAQQRTFE